MLYRRTFFRRTMQFGAGAVGVGCAGAAYGVWEASDVRIDRRTIAIPNLPGAFEGKTIGVLADLHHGPRVSLGFIRRVVRLANALRPDLFALVGDYAHKGTHVADQL